MTIKHLIDIINDCNTKLNTRLTLMDGTRSV